MDNTTTNSKGKYRMQPEIVREHLSRDVHAILSVCIKEFKADQLLEEKCFDVDAVLTGRSVATPARYTARVQPAAWAKASTGSDKPLRLAGRGNFIPSNHFGFSG